MTLLRVTSAEALFNWLIRAHEAPFPTVYRHRQLRRRKQVYRHFLFCAKDKRCPRGTLLRTSQGRIMSSYPGSTYEQLLVGIFADFDVNEVGCLDVHQLHQAFQAAIPLLYAIPDHVCSLETTHLLMAMVDVTNEGYATMQEFFWMNDTLYKLWSSFRDFEFCGWIWHANIAAAMACVRLHVTEDELNAVLGPKDSRSWVSLDQYFHLCAISVFKKFGRQNLLRHQHYVASQSQPHAMLSFQ
ncbi:hypothetical protein HPB50_018535 [Hyalomma asiaticum]|uniref:Uncharacterized protein n=1 Tax=Hyalomma asiaticum TaxID=266040 RepID=A0ACB7TKE3_HYAAI|nr:hypothetical protein HPB50_018535 [Hyalomma asiaticum]